MRGNDMSTHVLRFFGLVALQGLLLNQMDTTVNPYFNVLLYPLFILFLPLHLKAPYLVFFGFLVGMAVDATVPSWGIHASAGVFSGAARGILLSFFAPKGGFSPKDPIFSPANMGWQTFLQGTAFFIFLHVLWYFSVTYFAPAFAWDIVKKTAASWALTMIFVALYATLFNPKR